MGVLGGAIGAGISAIGSIFGGHAAAKAMQNVKSNLNTQKAENLNWYNRRYNEDATQRADAQAMIARTEEMIRNRNRQAEGAMADTGGSEESAAATKAANAQAHADATAQIAVSGAQRKDAIESQYQTKNEALQAELNDLERQKANNIAQATKGVVETGANIANML